MQNIEESIPVNAGARIHEIDGLRGIAILAVVIFHLLVLPLTPILSQIGIRDALTLLAYGVDLFFVVSGYLIGTILLRVNSASGVRAFYIRRILRIWPLYYLLLFIVYSIIPEKHTFSEAPYWSFFLFVFNFWESMRKGVHEALGPLWSVAIEEQFYVFGPLLFLFLNRKQVASFLLFCVALSPLVRLAFLYKTHIDVWKFTPTRLDGICIGLLLAIFLSDPVRVSWVAKRIRGFTILSCLLTISLIPSILLLPLTIWISFGFSLVAVTFGCVLLVVQVRSALHQPVRFLNWGFLRYLGLRCYSIYLFHIFWGFIATSMSDNFWVARVISFLLILLFAHLSWRYIEAPLINAGRKFPYGSVLNKPVKSPAL